MNRSRALAHRKSFFAFVAALTIFAAGCRAVDGSPTSDFGDSCQEDTDPASYGCIDIQGTVSGLRGQPLYNIDVSTVASTVGSITTGFALTDTEGHYQLRLLQTAAGTGTVSFALKATLRTNAGDELSSQTVNVNVQVTNLGERPDPVNVNFTLPVN